MRLYFGKGTRHRCIFTMENEYKVICALSNSATFDDLLSDGGWNGAIYGSIISKMSADGHLGMTHCRA